MGVCVCVNGVWVVTGVKVKCGASPLFPSFQVISEIEHQCRNVGLVRVQAAGCVSGNSPPPPSPASSAGVGAGQHIVPANRPGVMWAGEMTRMVGTW